MISRRTCTFALSTVLLLGSFIATFSAMAQTRPRQQRFWIAGRYDGNRMIIYFDTVKFNGTVPPKAPSIVEPVAPGFFMPVELPPSYIAQFENRPDAEHFALGQRYDVLVYGNAVEVTLTSLVGTEGDEGVGNDSYIGALATVTSKCSLLDGSDDMYFAVRPHREPDCDSPPQAWPSGESSTRYAEIVHEPLRFDVQSQIVSLLTQRMGTVASAEQRKAAKGRSPEFTVQSFRLTNGSVRYYATADWNGPVLSDSDFSLGAWLAPEPTLHILAVEKGDSDVYLPTILNVADLGGGKTGIILSTGTEDSNATVLVEYRDGLDMAHMPLLQSIAAGE